MRAILLLTALLTLGGARPAGAFDWASVGGACSDIRIPGFSSFIGKAGEWEKFQAKTQGEIDTLTNETCPTYLQSANGATGTSAATKMTLEAYRAAHTSTFRDAGDSTGRGEKHDKYLSDSFSATSAIHARWGFDFGVSDCGAAITGARKHIASALETIRSKSSGAGKSCAAIAEKIAAEGPVARRASAGSGGGPERGAQPESESTITGNLNEAILPMQTAGTSLHSKMPDSSDTTHNSPAPGDTGDARKPSENLADAAGGGPALDGQRAADRDFFSGRLDPWKAFGLADNSAPSGGENGGGGGPGRSPASTRAANAEPVPAENEDRSRFLHEFSVQAVKAEREPSPTLFEQVSQRYRQLTGRMR